MWKGKTTEELRYKILETANNLIGSKSKKYKNGYPELNQEPLGGFDCSGFITYVFKTVGIFVPDYIGQDGLQRPIRHADEYWDHYGVHVNNELKQPGDLVFFSRTGDFPTHIGIVRDDATYIHSPGIDAGCVETRTLQHEIITISGIGRALYPKNPIGFKSPVALVETPSYRYHHRAIY